ncbi:gliding motility-associated C-terminal domain-containing protein, partial [Chryseosolibacter indicus]
AVAGAYTFKYVVTGTAPCAKDSATVTVNVNVNEIANAGPDQSVCGTATLNANSPNTGTGLWSFAPGGDADGLGIIDNPSSPTSKFDGTIGQTYTLRWTITNGACSSFEDVQIKFNLAPSVADAGADQLICSQNYTTLNATAPTAGTGIWSVIEGMGGIPIPANDINAQFIGVTGTLYKLRWIVTNGTCPPSIDEVVINFAAAPTVVSPVTVCLNTTAPVLTATAVGATAYQWYSVSGGASTLIATTTTGSYTPTAAQLNVGTVGTTNFEVRAVYPCGTSVASAIVVNVSNTGSCGGGGNGPGGPINCGVFTIPTPKLTLPTCLTANNGMNDGAIELTITGGNLPAGQSYYVVLYDSILGGTQTSYFTRSIPVPPGVPTSFDNLPPSLDYQIFITDGTSTCILSQSLQVQSTVTATLDPASVKDAVCFDQPTGQAQITVTGGNAPYEYSTDNGTVWSTFTSNLTNLPVGTYSILVRDDGTDKCPAEVQITINNAPSKVSSIYEAKEASCNNNDGELKVSDPTGGNAPYTISFQGGLFENLTDSIVYKGLQRGNKNYRIRDVNGCEQSMIVNIPSPNQIIINDPQATVTPPSCESGGTDGSVVIAVDMDETQTPGPYKYGIARATEDESTITLEKFPNSGNSDMKSGLTAGNYYVLVSSDFGCPTRQDFTISGGAIAVDFMTEKFCEENKQVVQLSDIKGDNNAAFDVLVFDKFSGKRVDSIRVSPFPITNTYLIEDRNFLSKKGEYNLIVRQNQALCPIVKSDKKTVVISNPISASIEGMTASYPDMPTGSLKVVGITGGDPGYMITISLDSASSSLSSFEKTEPIEENENFELEKYYKKQLPAGRYGIVIEDESGCTLDLVGRVPLDNSVYAPNIFTPNDDGINDIFFVRNLGDSGNKLVITNRWGKEIYKSDNYQNNWRGEGAVDGIYFYRLQIGKNEPITGWVEIMRGIKP